MGSKMKIPNWAWERTVILQEKREGGAWKTGWGCAQSRKVTE